MPLVCRVMSLVAFTPWKALYAYVCKIKTGFDTFCAHIVMLFLNIYCLENGLIDLELRNHACLVAAPFEKMAEVINRTRKEAKARISKVCL